MSNYSDDIRSFDHDSRSPFYDDGGRDQAIEDRADEVKETLLSVTHKYEEAFVIDCDDNKIELSDFIADMQVESGIFAEFLQGNMYSDESYLRNKILYQLDAYCEKIATGLIDNMEQENEGI